MYSGIRETERYELGTSVHLKFRLDFSTRLQTRKITINAIRSHLEARKPYHLDISTTSFKIAAKSKLYKASPKNNAISLTCFPIIM